jgi:hypothetical protein
MIQNQILYCLAASLMATVFAEWVSGHINWDEIKNKIKK